MSDRPSEPADDSRAVSDADWEAFQQAAEASVRRPSQAGPAPREPSARARMVAARFRAQDEAAAKARGRRWGRKPERPEPWQPEGWRTGPAWQEMQGGRRGRWSRSQRVGTVFAVLCVLVGALWFADQRGQLHLGALGSSPQDTEPLAAETARPTSAPPTTLRLDLPTLDQPWKGSPARRWDGGTDAIELPEAEATGDVSAERTAEALATTKDFLVAANLDRDVLHGGRPDRALKLLDPLNDEVLDDLREGLRHPTENNDGGALFTRFDGDEVRLVGDEVKVRGRLTVEPGKQGGALIEADYTFVYALRHADDRDEVTRFLVRRVFTAVVAPSGWQYTPGKLWLAEYGAETAGITCAWEPDGLYHPSFPSTRGREDADGPTMDPYDRGRDIRGGGKPTASCGTASRV